MPGLGVVAVAQRLLGVRPPGLLDAGRRCNAASAERVSGQPIVLDAKSWESETVEVVGNGPSPTQGTIGLGKQKSLQVLRAPAGMKSIE